MPVLALDTSAAVAVALVADDGRPLAQGQVAERRRHAEALAPLIEGVLAEARLAPRDLMAVAVGTGPAPFTGLRVGLVTARTLGLALGVPVLGVCSLDVLAAQAVRDLGLSAGTEVFVAADARRREVYWARYRVSAPTDARPTDVVAPTGLACVAGPEVGPAAVAADAAAGAVVVGEGAALWPDALTPAEGAPLLPDAVELAQLALARRRAGEPTPTEPLYLRRPDVQEPTARKRALDSPVGTGGGT